MPAVRPATRGRIRLRMAVTMPLVAVAVIATWLSPLAAGTLPATRASLPLHPTTTVVGRLSLASVGPVGPAGSVPPARVPPPGQKAAGRITTEAAAILAPPSGLAQPVTSSGDALLLGGRVAQFRGINVPEAATLYSVNPGCGAQIDLERLFATLAPDSFVRVDFSEERAINPITGRRDWDALDRVVGSAAAAPTHPHLVISLVNQAGQCGDGHWLDSGWYSGGYRQVFDDNGDNWPRVSYWNYLDEVVARYAGTPAIAIWEPVGEPEAADCASGFRGTACYLHKSCPPSATAALRSFFDTVGAEIHRLDPSHLVGSGVIGGTQCGWAGAGSVAIHRSPGIDVETFHDYGSDAVPLPGELAQRLGDAREIGKPLIDEEVGIDARNQQGCTSLATRAAELGAKMRAAFAAGASGFMVWDFAEGVPDGRCDTRVRPGDPALGLLAA